MSIKNKLHHSQTLSKMPRKSLEFQIDVSIIKLVINASVYIWCLQGQIAGKHAWKNGYWQYEIFVDCLEMYNIFTSSEQNLICAQI